MKKILLAALVACCTALPALAQVATIPQRYSTATLSTGTGVCGTPSAGAAHVYVLGDSSASLDISAGLTGTVSFMASFDQVNFFAVQAYPQGGGAPASSTTSSGRWQLPVATYRMLCVYISAFTSGSTTAVLTSSTAVFSPTQDVGTAANLAATTGNNATLVVQPGQWTATSSPASATQASASRVAGAGLTRHVAQCVTIGIVPVAAQAAPVVFNLRDGATGAGTVLWSVSLIGQAGVAQPPATFCGLNIAGSAATAMTLESAGAPAATNFAYATLTGFDAN